MDSKKRENILTVLEHMRKRSHMYFSSEVPAVATFLDGFKLALLLAIPTPNFDTVFQEMIVERGWKVSAQAVWRQMQERGYSTVWEKILHQPVVESEINSKS